MGGVIKKIKLVQKFWTSSKNSGLVQKKIKPEVKIIKRNFDWLCVVRRGFGQRSADKMVASFFTLEEILVNSRGRGGGGYS